MSCPCGCPDPVKPGRTYATTRCRWRGNTEHFRRIGKLVHQRHPELQRRAQQAGYRAVQQRIAERVKDLTPRQAYERGYKAGYTRAYLYWKYRAEKRTAC